MNISIIYEEDDFLVINKPSGVLTHPKNENDQSENISSWAVKKYPQISNVGEDSLRPGIVHRLDKGTSGLLIIAKTQESFEYFKNKFKNRDIKKTYLALVVDHFQNKKGIINSPIGKIGTKQTTDIKGAKDLKEREAITEYKVIKEFDNFSLLEVYPKTGRTHQIRVHMNSIHHPIVGDTLYGGRKKEIPQYLDRLFLHAFKLEFISPSGKALSFETDLPEELNKVLDSLEKT